ncbi:hypothetical protein [Mesorhizobium sp. BR1-1-3]|uniref:hypothetical protein n=1 Tax=Mesorhizobium sp. BR1-1-3 TaxID=2876651 RepID=UPI001CD0B1CA|nr:hypothetical protein [Mesorhizobium sp. BR1-1-3]
MHAFNPEAMIQAALGGDFTPAWILEQLPHRTLIDGTDKQYQIIAGNRVQKSHTKVSFVPTTLQPTVIRTYFCRRHWPLFRRRSLRYPWGRNVAANSPGVPGSFSNFLGRAAAQIAVLMDKVGLIRLSMVLKASTPWHVAPDSATPLLPPARARRRPLAAPSEVSPHL